MSSRYYSIEEKEQFKFNAMLKIGGSVGVWAFSLWMWGNQQTFIQTFFFIYALILLGAEALLFWGMMDYARGKGYGWKYGFFALFHVLGLAALVFLPDKWEDQTPPPISVKRMSW